MKKIIIKYFCEECKYKITRNKVENLINDNLDSRSFDNETYNEPDNESHD